VKSNSVPGLNLSRRRLAIIAGGAVAALVIGYFAGQVLIPAGKNLPAQTSSAAQGATTSGAAGTTGAAGAGAGASATTPASGTTAGSGLSASTGAPDSHAPLTAFADRAGGFRMAYPRGWTRLQSKDAGVRLLASGPNGASLLVRLATLGVAVNGKTLDQVEALTTAKLKAQRGLQIVAGPKLLSINNLPGFLFIYSFVDPTTGRSAAHSQITLFSGKRMYTLVYQTAAAATLVTLAPLFDQVTDTFHAT
jgi:hypothetical protein